MDRRQSLPLVWLVSDERNDARLEETLRRLPSHSGFVYRHYHLNGDARRARFRVLADLCADKGHVAIVSGDAALASEYYADGVYGPSARLGDDPLLLRCATAHDAAEIDAANAVNADAVFVSPVHETASHPGATPLGVDGFRDLARRARMPAIALGGMDAERAIALGARRWAAIDGLVH